MNVFLLLCMVISCLNIYAADLVTITQSVSNDFFNMINNAPFEDRLCTPVSKIGHGRGYLSGAAHDVIIPASDYEMNEGTINWPVLNKNKEVLYKAVILSSYFSLIEDPSDALKALKAAHIAARILIDTSKLPLYAEGKDICRQMLSFNNNFDEAAFISLTEEQLADIEASISTALREYVPKDTYNDIVQKLFSQKNQYGAFKQGGPESLGSFLKQLKGRLNDRSKALSIANEK